MLTTWCGGNELNALTPAARFPRRSPAAIVECIRCRRGWGCTAAGWDCSVAADASPSCREPPLPTRCMACRAYASGDLAAKPNILDHANDCPRARAAQTVSFGVPNAIFGAPVLLSGSQQGSNSS